MPFDICDGKNKYNPCQKCGATFGMGLSTRNNRLAVECGECGRRGPEVIVPEMVDAEWLRNCAARDEQAFLAWNGAA